MEKYKKIRFAYCVLFLFIMLLACNNAVPDSHTNIDSPQVTTDTNIGKIITLNNGDHCFAYTQNNDTVSLSLHLNDSLVTGKLIYRLYQKDMNAGTLKGLLRGDTLLADYSFLSEGTRSVRQVIFLRKGNILLEGTGSMRETSGRLIFTDIKAVAFNGNIVLEPVDCAAVDSK